jgi:DNA-binding PadR family transcriptional regulator
MDKEFLKGYIDIILMCMVDSEWKYGYQIANEVKNCTEGKYLLSEGTLYSALNRLESKGYLDSYWSKSNGNRRKYYRITDRGRKELSKKINEICIINSLIEKFLRRDLICIKYTNT